MLDGWLERGREGGRGPFRIFTGDKGDEDGDIPRSSRRSESRCSFRHAAR